MGYWFGMDWPVDSTTTTWSSSVDMTHTHTTKQLAIRQKILSRMLFLLYSICDTTMIPLIIQYALWKSATFKGVLHFDGQQRICLNSTESEDNGTTESVWQSIEVDAIEVVLYSNFLQLLPSIPVVLILGVWGDATNKRVLNMAVPVYGRALFALLVLTDYYLNLNNFALLYTGKTVNS